MPDNDDGKNDRIRCLEDDNRKIRQELADLRGEGKVAGAIVDVANRLDRLLEPLRALSPSHELGNAKGAVIALRRSLKRPTFDAPRTDFGNVFPKIENNKGSAAP